MHLKILLKHTFINILGLLSLLFNRLYPTPQEPYQSNINEYQSCESKIRFDRDIMPAGVIKEHRKAQEQQR